MALTLATKKSLQIIVTRGLYDAPEEQKPLGSATCFVAAIGDRAALITNRHVVTGRATKTNEPIWSSSALPERVVVHHHRRGEPGKWVEVTSSLYDESGRARWYVHPNYSPAADVVALPLELDAYVDVYPYSVEQRDDPLAVGPATDLSIIGFPFGRASAGRFGIWARGTIASEPELDFEGEPVFLIDSRTREGQCGARVR